MVNPQRCRVNVMFLTFFQVVLRSSEVSQVFQGQRHQRHPHDRGVLHRADRPHPVLLHLHLLHAGNRGLREARAVEAEHLGVHLHCFGCDECHVDDQNFKGLPQGPLSHQTGESWQQPSERETGLSAATGHPLTSALPVLRRPTVNPGHVLLLPH